MKTLGFITGYVLGICLKIVMYVWIIIAAIPLFTGILMMDLMLRIFGIEKTYLLLNSFTLWAETLSAYLKTHKLKNN